MFLTSGGASSNGFAEEFLESGAERPESCAKSDAMKEREVGRLVVIWMGTGDGEMALPTIIPCCAANVPRRRCKLPIGIEALIDNMNVGQCSKSQNVIGSVRL